MQNYINLSLETHLFFSRIMKEHALFLEAVFPCKDRFYIQRSDFYRQQFEKLLEEVIKISDGRINFPILQSDELVTEFTIPAEKHTEHLNGISINTNISRMETNLRAGECSEKSMEMMHLVHCINKKALELLSGLIDFKESIIIIEPVGARWYKSFSLCKAVYDESAVITAPGIESFRECVVVIQNGIRMLDKNNQLVKTANGEEGEEPDAEDTGEKGYNYRSERFANRLKRNPQISKIFSSRIHGGPATPVFRVYSGERVIFRTVMPADKPRNVGFCIHGHRLKKPPIVPLSKPTSLQGGISIGNTFNLELDNRSSSPGDYLYRSGSFKWDVESGMWGILRVLKKGCLCKCKSIYNFCRCELGGKQ